MIRRNDFSRSLAHPAGNSARRRGRRATHGGCRRGGCPPLAQPPGCRSVSGMDPRDRRGGRRCGARRGRLRVSTVGDRGRGSRRGRSGDRAVGSAAGRARHRARPSAAESVALRRAPPGCCSATHLAAACTVSRLGSTRAMCRRWRSSNGWGSDARVSRSPATGTRPTAIGPTRCSSPFSRESGAGTDTGLDPVHARGAEVRGLHCWIRRWRWACRSAYDPRMPPMPRSIEGIVHVEWRRGDQASRDQESLGGPVLLGGGAPRRRSTQPLPRSARAPPRRLAGSTRGLLLHQHRRRCLGPRGGRGGPRRLRHPVGRRAAGAQSDSADIHRLQSSCDTECHRGRRFGGSRARRSPLGFPATFATSGTSSCSWSGTANTWRRRARPMRSVSRRAESP